MYAEKLEIHQCIDITNAIYLLFDLNPYVSAVFSSGYIDFIVGAVLGREKDEREMYLLSFILDLVSLLESLISEDQMLVANEILELFT